ncbi:hypothetical protein LCGC14_0455450 [marine sediment metagenome]|uniref:Uncharacterized protein n=1 Tax=marine sediment metagenome TaxID=412755 RepID=A0A0F9SLR6_9ZZZZ
MSEPLFPNDVSIDEYLMQCITIDELLLDDAFKRTPAELAYWNARFAEANRSFLIEKLDCDRMGAQLYLEHREILLTLERKPTEAMIKASVESDDRYYEARTKLVTAEAERVRLRGVCEAMITKKDMLQSLGAKLRAEMSGDPAVREQHSDYRAGRTQE